MSRLLKEYQYFTLHECPLKPGRKTHDYDIISKSDGGRLGGISWYGPWRLFVFFPASSTVWSYGCLADVNRAIRLVGAMWKGGKK